MSASLKLHELTLSPNNVKVRIGLGYKGLEYERIPLQFETFPGNRDELIEVSRQPRTPVLVHGETVVFDSRGILRYLEANFPDTPPLFSTDYGEMGAIEQWEAWCGTDLGPPIGMLFGQALSDEKDPKVIDQANALFHEATGRIESQLGETRYLVRDTPSAADVAAAPAVNLGMLSEAAAATSPIAAFFRECFHLGDGREKTRAWVKDLMAHDEAFAAWLD